MTCRLGEDSDYFLPDPPEKEVDDDSEIDEYEDRMNEGWSEEFQGKMDDIQEANDSRRYE